MTDPYSVLGITPGADDETIKKAYRQKCKQYHPDLHPDDPAAEEHFKEVQAAYSEIMRIKQGGGTAYRQSGQTYGQSNGYSQQYQDPFAGGGFGGCPQLRVGECRAFAAVNRSDSTDDFSLRIHGYGYGDDTGIVTVVVFGIW